MAIARRGVDQDGDLRPGRAPRDRMIMPADEAQGHEAGEDFGFRFDLSGCMAMRAPMPLLTIVPPMPGAERRFTPFVNFVRTCGWETEFVRLEWTGIQPNFDSTALFPQVDAQTAGKVVMGFSLGALYAHLGALRARHLILGSISPFFLEDDDEPRRWMISYLAGNAHTPADVLVGAKEDDQMHRRATAVRDFYRRHTYTDVPGAEHELWHPNYLQAIKTALGRLKSQPASQDSESQTPRPDSVGSSVRIFRTP